MELRCDSKLFGIAVEEHLIEVKCSSRFCGAVRGEVIVFHRFDLKTGEVSTKKFKEPRSQ